MLGSCSTRNQNSESVTQEGTGSTYQSTETLNNKLCCFDICQNVENVSHKYPGKQYESLELFAETRMDKESRTNADVTGNLGVEAMPSNFQQNMLNIGGKNKE